MKGNGEFIDEFTTELNDLLKNINISLDYIKIDAEKRGFSASEMKHTDGSYAVERLLSAKAQVLHSLVMLRTMPRTKIEHY